MLYDIRTIKVNGRKRPIDEGKVRILASSIAESGLLQPIGINSDGVLIFGAHRLEAHKLLGLAQIEAKVFDIDPLDAELAEIDENLQRNDLDVLAQGEHLYRRNQILEEKGLRAKPSPGANQYTLVGEMVSPTKTTADLAAEIGLSERSAQQRMQIARKIQPEVKEIIRNTSIADSTTQLLSLARLNADQQLQTAQRFVHEEHQAAQRHQRMENTVYSKETNEWYTPAWVTALAAKAMGNIDLDPASSEFAQSIHNADEWYGLDHPDLDRRDGFVAKWYGNVWLNPPYGKDEGESETNATRWSRKLIVDWRAGQVSAGVLLVKAALGYNWFEDLWCELPVCFLRKRIPFIRPDGTDGGQSKQGTALFYVGDNYDCFRETFAPYGHVILPDTEEL